MSRFISGVPLIEGLAVAGRELGWVLPNVARHVAGWRRRARLIPGPELRHDALSTLHDERFNTEGAALFAILPRRRSADLLRLLVAYEVIWDYLDTLAERQCEDVVRNGVQLHRALVDALDPGAGTSDYYRHHPWRDDGGYLPALVATCQALCVRLPGFERVRFRLACEARRAAVCGINHDADPTRRDAALEAWARREFSDDLGLPWWELSATSSSSLGVHALLALAAETEASEADVEAVHAAYVPWIGLASTMLDAFVDWPQDRASGSHSYMAHYGGIDAGADRLRQIVAQAYELALALPRGERHALILDAMLAMYLSGGAARTPELKGPARRIRGAGGPLSALILPALRGWRLGTRRA